MIHSHFGDNLYYLVQALDSAQLPSNTNTCEGCCFEEDRRCEQPPVPEPTVQCYGDLIFIEGTDEALAKHISARMDYAINTQLSHD